MFPLIAGTRNQTLKVVNNLSDPKLTRLGITNGAIITYLFKIPAGPVVIRCGRQELVIGKALASTIEVDNIE